MVRVELIIINVVVHLFEALDVNGNVDLRHVWEAKCGEHQRKVECHVVFFQQRIDDSAQSSVGTLLVIAEVEALLDGRQNHELDLLLVWVSLENMDGCLTRSDHWTYENVLNLDLVRMTLSVLTL